MRPQDLSYISCVVSHPTPETLNQSVFHSLASLNTQLKLVLTWFTKGFREYLRSLRYNYIIVCFSQSTPETLHHSVFSVWPGKTIKLLFNFLPLCCVAFHCMLVAHLFVSEATGGVENTKKRTWQDFAKPQTKSWDEKWGNGSYKKWQRHWM